MQWLSPTLLAIQVISALVIIVLVLLQQGKGSEMGAAFGSGSAGSLFGASGAANFLSRSTKWAAILFFVTTGGLAYIAHHPHSRGFDGGVMQGFKSAPAKAPEAPATPPASAVPTVPTAPAQKGASSQSSTAPSGSSNSSAGSAPSVPSAGTSNTGKSSSSDSVPSMGTTPASGDKANAQSGSQAAPAAKASGSSGKSDAGTSGNDKQSDASKK
jgi:preprotein translocase subunit SecG